MLGQTACWNQTDMLGLKPEQIWVPSIIMWLHELLTGIDCLHCIRWSYTATYIAASAKLKCMQHTDKFKEQTLLNFSCSPLHTLTSILQCACRIHKNSNTLGYNAVSMRRLRYKFIHTRLQSSQPEEVVRHRVKLDASHRTAHFTAGISCSRNT